MDKVFELAKKLHAMTQRGVGGEKENAQTFLNRILKENSLTIEDIIGDKLSERTFRVKNKKHAIFFNQVAASIVGRNREIYTYPSALGKRVMFVDLTDIEFIELKTRFEFYWEVLQKEETIFYKAFIQKNELYCKPTDDAQDQKELTPEQNEELLALLKMMKGLKKHTQLKQLD